MSMSPSQYPLRERPAFDADERTQLIGWLDTQRATARWKCEELSEADAHRSVLPSSPLMTMAGVMSHLRWAENLWFEVVLLGRPAVGPIFDGPKDASMMVDGVPLAKLLDDYDRQVAVSNEIIAAGSLDDVGRHPDFDTSGASLRWIMFHMIEETARHAGHLDAIREILDGRTGHY
ncbi:MULTISPECIES: DinB family protein [unclassified Streptomyces]|uniref:DinB family protein n=2 Tax=unclassified Streptomyces TaxID=2593676 RepID=UPI002E77A767|nr:DinB family protein [Streptomyces sp. JV190]MEE1845535.1 DinB family protein [Streptomyces sp. JV190]